MKTFEVVFLFPPSIFFVFDNRKKHRVPYNIEHSFCYIVIFCVFSVIGVYNFLSLPWVVINRVCFNQSNALSEDYPSKKHSYYMGKRN